MQVDPDWIDDYIDGFDTIGITFYDKDKNPTNLDSYKNIYKTRYEDNHPLEGGHTSYPGSPLFIKNGDYYRLADYISEQIIKAEQESDINSVAQYIKDTKRKEDEEDNIRKNIEQINKTKQYILNVIIESPLSENDKYRFLNNVINIDIEGLDTTIYSEQQIFEIITNRIRERKDMELIFGSNHREHNLYQNNLINNENIEIKRIDIKRFDDEYIIPKEFDTYTIKIKTPHIIFHYDFITQQFSLSKMLIDTEYNMKNINDRLIIATKPILYGSMLLYDRGLDVKESLFYIYKVDANPEFDSVEKALKPILKYYDNKGRPWYESSLLQQESNVAPNIQNVAQNVEQRQTSCFGRACETFRRYARINPRGGKRTRKQKKTRKHKKAHRKIIHKKK
jgi:hypothetical protein